VTNNQLFLALLGTLITLLGAFYKVLKDYMDARFNSVESTVTRQFDGVNKRLDFLLEHFADHEERISKVEERTKNL
jgi:hypothetical protein